jgi:hypothetical protein
MDVTERKKAERETASALNTLQMAPAEVKTLTGLLPICAWCKRIRTESGQWAELESYGTEHSNANFSLGVCPKCLPKLRSNKEG